MSRYHAVPVELAKTHIQKLADGQSVKLSNENLQGQEHVLHLTKSQAKRYLKALESGKGMTLRLSSAQLKYHKKMEGSGIWDSVKDFAKTNVLPAVKDVAKDLGKQAVNAGVNFGADKLKDFVGKKISGLGAKRGKGLLGGDKGKMRIMPVPVAVTPTPIVAPDRLDIAVHHPQMLSVRGAKPTAKMEGEGFFDNVLDFAGSTITGARDVALAGLYSRLAGRGLKGSTTVGRGRGRPKKTTGGSFRLPGN